MTLLACAGCVQEGAVKYPGWTYMGEYEPANPSSLDELQQNIREKVVEHLKSRLGEDFFRKLRFTGGQVVDFTELYRVNPRAKHYEWTVHAYDLHFEFTMPNKGIKSYTAQIKLNSDGSVLSEIDLPDFARHPEKLNFTSIAKVKRVAEKAGFDLTEAETEIDYDLRQDSIIWRFTKVVSDDGLIIQYKNIEVDAHSGIVIRQYGSEAIR